MIAVFAVFAFLLLAAGAFVGANFCEPGSPAQQGLMGLAGALVGLVLPNVPKALLGMSGTPKAPSSTTPLTIVVFLVLAGLSMSTMSCAHVKPGPFFEATVDCAKVNPEASSATSGVITCLTASVAGNPGACLSQLVTVAHFTVDEVACIVADIAQRENNKVKLEGDPKALEVRNTAVGWLRDQNISIRNSYAGAQ